MSWFYLILAILLETAGTSCMKLSAGFTKTLPSVLILFFYISSLFFFTNSLNGIKLNVAYAVWSGLGTALVALLGFIFFKEPLSAMKIVSIGWIILGVIGLNLSISHG
ncbi:DMT family transporter [Mastigocoleus testarum]|uniref:Small multidrug resistance protein n=1 Tax=Mastigocoleus testarum BC008 TaxID=371196 RepID=A0A0V7ZU96_9CYAN|nr:multidrug efflux SMR transporter [Mastigocoleus testarum]KST68072.1 hypothetical protein BC008_00040 [Mastigocoleus testarum BC008]